MARIKYKIWLKNNMPKNGTIYEEMTSTRRSFKSELKKCKKNKNNEISKSIQEKFASKSMKDFWREVRNKNSISSSTSIIDGHSEQNEIINLFSDKFIIVILFSQKKI